MIAQGSVIDERYEIVGEIGVGGFGSVFKAIQKGFDRPVAIKTLNTTLLHESDGPARFEREARAISALKHKNIVCVYGYGSWQQAPYMVMELLEGKSLQALLVEEKRLAPPRAARIARQIFDGLACSHNAGVVHRDLKAANIFVIPAEDGSELVKLIDFGLAKLMPGYGLDGQKLTETGYALGTCHYMAPEQALGKPVDERADIYAAGCILYQMLSGKLPFDADNSVAVMYQHINDSPQSLTEIADDHAMLRGLDAVVSHCMAKDPEHRYASCNDAIADLDSVLNGNAQHLKVNAHRTQQATRPGIIRSKAFAIAIAALLAGTVVFVMLQMGPKEIEQQRGNRAAISAEIRSLIDSSNRATEVSDYDSAIRDLKAIFEKLPHAEPMAPHREFELIFAYLRLWEHKITDHSRTYDEKFAASYSAEKSDEVHREAKASGVDKCLDRALVLRRRASLQQRDLDLMHLMKMFGRFDDAINIGVECAGRPNTGRSVTAQRHYTFSLITKMACHIGFEGRWTQAIDCLNRLLLQTRTSSPAGKVPKVHYEELIQIMETYNSWPKDQRAQFSGQAKTAGIEQYADEALALRKKYPKLRKEEKTVSAFLENFGRKMP